MASVIGIGEAHPFAKGRAEAPIVSQPPSATEIGRPPSQGRLTDAFRPAWPSWIAGMASCEATKSTTRFIWSRCALFHSPRQ
jgi:hypothetical protein